MCLGVSCGGIILEGEAHMGLWVWELCLGTQYSGLVDMSWRHSRPA